MGDEGFYAMDDSGDGWTYDSLHYDPAILKLNGAQNLNIDITGSCTIELAPGSRNSMGPISRCRSIRQDNGP